MKSKKSIVLSALLTIVMCASLVAGATLALFTANSEVNIAITSGKIDVAATVDLSSVQYKQLGTDYSANGTMFAGSATIDGGSVNLSKIVPGDGVKFNIVVKNGSDILVNYRTVWMCEDDGLSDALSISVNGVAYDGTTLYSDWQTAAAGSANVVVPVTVELPENAEDCMGKQCTLVFKVEATQGNVAANNEVARIGENSYASLDEAVAALKEGDVLEIVRPGTYAPFTITAKNVTVKGIANGKKSESTVIKTTANKNIQAYADGITLDSLYIDSRTSQTGIKWFKKGAVDIDIDNNSGTTADNVTIQNCTLEGKGSYALMWNSLNCIIKNNVFNGYEIGLYTMMDNYSAKGIVIEGNEFNGVQQPVNGYWGGPGAEDGFGLVINNNKFDDGAILIIWDYRQSEQWNKGETTTDKPGLRTQIKGNSGKFVVSLTHCDMLVENGNDIVLENGASILYRTVTLFNGIDEAANYEVTNPDGSALVSATGDTTTLTVANGKTYVYALSEGNYALKNKVTGELFAFSVEHTAVGAIQSYTVLNAPETAADSAAAITAAINNAASDNVSLALGEGTYELPAIQNKTVTISGTKDTVLDMTKSSIIGAQNAGLTLNFEGVTVKFGIDDYKGITHSQKVVYTNCKIYGKQFLYATNVEFINCEFVQENVDYNVWTYGATNVLFKDCTFTCKGKSVLIYNEGAIATETVEFQNCKFNASAAVSGKAAIEVDSTFTSYNVIIDQATADNVTGFATDTISESSVWNVKKQVKTTVVTVAGKTVYSK